MDRKKRERRVKNNQKGYIHIYTGDGKGKTTAAIGLACRALGAGWEVLFAQFLKKGRFSEIKALERFDRIKILQFGSGKFVKGKPSTEDIENALAGLKQVAGLARSGKYHLVILDEINVALQFGLLEEEAVLSLIDSAPPETELVLTGRNAPESLVRRADLVTECRKVKHYYDNGVMARTGIEK
jgi:cob(I)alamin adenosyltransferase